MPSPWLWSRQVHSHCIFQSTLNAGFRLIAGARDSPLSGGSVQPRSATSHGLRHRAQSGHSHGTPKVSDSENPVLDKFNSTSKKRLFVPVACLVDEVNPSSPQFLKRPIGTHDRKQGLGACHPDIHSFLPFLVHHFVADPQHDCVRFQPLET
jgi:hypothetical protein